MAPHNRLQESTSASAMTSSLASPATTKPIENSKEKDALLSSTSSSKSSQNIKSSMRPDMIGNNTTLGWKQQILYQLNRILFDTTTTENSCDEFYRYCKRGAGFALAVMASFLLYRHHRRLPPKWLLRLVWSATRNSNRDTDKLSQRKRLFLSWKSFGTYLASIVASNLAMWKRPEYARAPEVSLSLLRTAAKQGFVQTALIGPSYIVFSTNDGWRRTNLPGNIPTIQSDILDLLNQGGCTDVSTMPESMGSKLATPLLAALPFIYLGLVYRIIKGIHSGKMDAGDFFSSKLLKGIGRNNGGSASLKVKTKFTDVAGLDDILPEVREIVTYLQHPSGYHAFGAELPRGILLHGPPGTGKTLLARAIAGEADCDAFASCSGSDFVEMYVGRGASRIRSLFNEVRMAALRNHGRKFGCEGGNVWRWLSEITLGCRFTARTVVEPAERLPTGIIFIDELDALAKSRAQGAIHGNEERDQTLNQLLTEMDGFIEAAAFSDPLRLVTVIVIGATNRPEMLDPAILRRFDRQLFVHLPSPAGRKEILKIHAAKTNCRVSTIHWEYLSDQTHNFSGSDLKQIVNDAALLAVRQKSKRIEQGHFLQAIQRSKSTKVQRSRVEGGSSFDSRYSSSEPPLLHPFLWHHGKSNGLGSNG